jgi:hypothetical protein
MDSLGSLSLVGLIVLSFCWAKLKANGTKALRVIRTTLAKDAKILKILSKVRKSSKADRVVLGLIHNSSIYSANYHLLKLSVLHESLGEGVISIKSIAKDIPLAMLNVTFDLDARGLDQSFSFRCEDHDSDTNLHFVKFEIYGMYNFLLRYQSVPIGLLSLQFTHKPPYESLTQLMTNCSEGGYDLAIAKLELIAQLV